jgi:uncharacterized protein (UPF0333 family)
MLRLKRKGQSTAEYAIVIGLVIAAAVGMQIYVKRGLQAKIKGAVDYNDPSASAYMGTLDQYEPDYATTEDMISTRKAKEKTDTLAAGGVKREIVGTEESSRTGTTKIAATP